DRGACCARVHPGMCAGLSQAGSSADPGVLAAAGSDARVRCRTFRGAVMVPVEADRGVPALVGKIGRYPLHSGGVGAIRTLGRLGVPVYATTEDPFTPAALSRYCTGRFKWRTSGLEEPGSLVRGLTEIAERIGRRSVIVPV